MWLWYFISKEKGWDCLHPLCDLVIIFTKSNPIGSVDPNVYQHQIYGINHWERITLPNNRTTRYWGYVALSIELFLPL